METNPLMEGMDEQKIPEPLTVVIFGASGDLTRTKIIPALYSLFKNGYFRDFTIVGFARRPWTDDEFRALTAAMIAPESGGADPDPTNIKNRDELEKIKSFCDRVHYISSEFESREGYELIGERFPFPANRIFYLATPPSYYETIVEWLGSTGLSDESRGFSRIIVEKPFGHDLETARRLNKVILGVFTENQVFRIDHYLGKEAVQNLFVLRFANSIFEPLWNNRYIESVQITVAEKAGIGTRGNFYETSGALRDVVQNHLLQLLSVIAMEPPNVLSAENIRDEKVKLVRAIRPVMEKSFETDVVMGQYRSGIIDGTSVDGYGNETNVAPESLTETFVALRLFVDSWRWSGVPFLLRTGKRLRKKLTEIAIRFKPPVHAIFSRWITPGDIANTLIIRVQPDEGIIANFNTKVPGFENVLRRVNMSFAFGSSFGVELPEAYERLLLDAMTGDSMLYMRSDEIESSWEYITQILTLWRNRAATDLRYYPAGSSGPEEAKKLAALSGVKWRKL